MEKIIKKLKRKYEDFDFYIPEYKNQKSKIEICCKKHGVFEKTINNALNKKIICKECYQEEKNESFIKKLREKYEDIYDYSLVDYKTPKSNIKLVCEKHGVFEQRVDYLLKNGGCKICKSLDNYLKKSNIIHNNKYDYSLVDYIDAHKKVKIICPEHGIFEQNLVNHSNGQNCPKCSYEKKYNNINNFIKQAIEIHGDKYDYSLVEYINSRTKIKILCSKHGMFEQLPNLHIHKQTGCPKCNTSKNELLLEKILTENNISFINQKKFTDCKDKRELPFDFYLPEYNICIEYDGEQHFNSIPYFGGDETLKQIIKRDKIKNNYCDKNNIKLLRIKYNDNLLEKIFDYFFENHIELK
jgi:hypothetical protein